MQIARQCQQARAPRRKFIRFCARLRPNRLRRDQKRWKNQYPLNISTRPMRTRMVIPPINEPTGPSYYHDNCRYKNLSQLLGPPFREFRRNSP
jgi:hypothetical protein